MGNAVWLALTLGGGVAPRVAAEEPAGGGGLLTGEGGLGIWTVGGFGLVLYILKRSAWPVLLQAGAGEQDPHSRTQKRPGGGIPGEPGAAGGKSGTTGGN